MGFFVCLVVHPDTRLAQPSTVPVQPEPTQVSEEER